MSQLNPLFRTRRSSSSWTCVRAAEFVAPLFGFVLSFLVFGRHPFIVPWCRIICLVPLAICRQTALYTANPRALKPSSPRPSISQCCMRETETLNATSTVDTLILARMAQQFLAVPATSASAARVFSLAGRIFSDLTQHQNDTTLEERMWAKINRKQVLE